MNILILSHVEASQFSPRIGGLQPCSMIRITSWDKWLPLKFQNEFESILQVKFADVVDFEDKDVFGFSKKFQRNHALEIKNFVDGLREDLDCLVIHCDAGQSRSPATGIAIARYLGLNDQVHSLEWNPRYMPNPRVRKILGVVMGEASYEQQQEIYDKLWGWNRIKE